MARIYVGLLLLDLAFQPLSQTIHQSLRLPNNKNLLYLSALRWNEKTYESFGNQFRKIENLNEEIIEDQILGLELDDNGEALGNTKNICKWSGTMRSKL